MWNFDCSRFWKILLIGLWCLPGCAQTPAPSQPPDSAQGQSAAVQPKDPLRRQTPKSAVLNFIKYAHRRDFATAAKFLELKTIKEKQEGADLARRLHILMNTSLRGSISTLSDVPEGSDDDTPEPNLEVVGRFLVQDKDVKFLLVRVVQKDTGPIWLVSEQTVSQVPELSELAGSSTLDRYLPEYLTDNLLVGIAAGRWLAWLLSIPVAWFLAWMLVSLPQRLWRIGSRLPTDPAQQHRVGSALRLVVAVLIHSALIWLIGMPLFYRIPYFRGLSVLLTFSVAWLVARLADRAYERAGRRPLRRESQSLLQLVHRLVELSVFLLAVLIAFTLLGFDTKTMLAGVGIGGVALALAAQKTLENLFGGVTLVMDNAISVGDDCVISNRQVTVREIGLRSITGTTLEGTDMSFPNGLLTQSNIENLSRRTKYLIFTTLTLRFESTLAQLQYAIVQVRELLYSHARVEQETARFRLAGLSNSGYQVELFAYIRSTNSSEFTAIREDLLFRILKLAHSAGVAFAVPVQTTYVSQQPAINEEKLKETEHLTKAWQDANENPFPDFSPSHIAEMRGSVAYPPERSVLSEEQTPVNQQVKRAV